MTMIVSSIKYKEASSEDSAASKKIRAKLTGYTITINSGNTIYELKALSHDKAAKKALKELCDTINLGFGSGPEKLRNNLLQRMNEGKNVFKIIEDNRHIKIQYATLHGEGGTDRINRLKQIDHHLGELSKTSFFNFSRKKTLKSSIAFEKERLKKSINSESAENWKALNVQEPHPIFSRTAAAALAKQELSSRSTENSKTTFPERRRGISEAMVYGDFDFKVPAEPVVKPPKKIEEKALKGKAKIKHAIFHAMHGKHTKKERMHTAHVPYENYQIGHIQSRVFSVHPQIYRDLNQVQSSNMAVQVSNEDILMQTVESGKIPWFSAVKFVRGSDAMLSDALTIDIMGVMAGKIFFEDVALMAKEHGTKTAPHVVPLPGSVPRSSLAVVGDCLVITREMDFCSLNKKLKKVPAGQEHQRSLEAAEKIIRPTLKISIPLSNIDSSCKEGLAGLKQNQFKIDYTVEEIDPQFFQRKENLEAQLEKIFVRHARKDLSSEYDEEVLKGFSRELIRDPALQKLIAEHAEKGDQAISKERLAEMLEYDGDEHNVRPTSLQSHWREFCENVMDTSEEDLSKEPLKEF